MDSITETVPPTATASLQSVRIIALDVPFWNLLVFFFKAAFAAIPALIIISLILSALGIAFGILGLGFLSSLLGTQIG